MLKILGIDPYTILITGIGVIGLVGLGIYTQMKSQCDALPSAAVAAGLIRRQAEDVARLKAIAVGVTDVGVGDSDHMILCPDKATVAVYYANEEQVRRLRALMPNGAFHGLPIRWIQH